VAMQITPMVGWKDVCSQKGVKMQLMEAVEGPQKHQDAFRHIGTLPPSGVLLFGPPRVGTRQSGKALHVNLFSRDRMNLKNKFKGGDKKVKPKNGVVVLKYVDHGTIGSCSGAASHF
nr:calmodulin-interacting protein 111 isoform X1 [Tanacetum cinerariifolium]